MSFAFKKVGKNVIWKAQNCKDFVICNNHYNTDDTEDTEKLSNPASISCSVLKPGLELNSTSGIYENNKYVSKLIATCNQLQLLQHPPLDMEAVNTPSQEKSSAKKGKVKDAAASESQKSSRSKTSKNYREDNVNKVTEVKEDDNVLKTRSPKIVNHDETFVKLHEII